MTAGAEAPPGAGARRRGAPNRVARVGRRAMLVAIPLALWVLAPRVHAQDPSDSAAYRALTQTPAGALAPLLDVSVTGQQSSSTVFDVRYGIMSFDSHEYTHDFGFSVSFPLGRTALSATGGYYWPNCTNGACHSHIMGSLGLAQNLVAISTGEEGRRATFDVGLAAQLGFARPADTTLVSGEISIPVSLVPAPRGLRLVPYVAPGVGVGLVSPDSGVEAGLQFTFAAGVGLISSNFAANVVLSRVFLKGGNWLVGVGLSFGKR